MPTSAEHQFVAEHLGVALENFSSTRLFGVLEADRKKHDYACILERDCARPLVAQVLWSHTEGVHKDLIALLHDRDAMLKVYLVKDTTKHRLKIDEVISEYRNNEATKKLLQGLKLIFLPSEFDADRLCEQRLMSSFISSVLCRDLLFSTVFGRLSPFDVRLFSNHGGPTGLKYTVLAEITKNGLIHNPTFKKRIGYSTNSPLREVTTLLSALGLVQNIDHTNIYLPTLKGRMFLDLTKRILYEELYPQYVLGDLGVVKEIIFGDPSVSGLNYMQEMISSAKSSKVNFGCDLLEGVNELEPTFHSSYEWKGFYDKLNEPSGMRFSKELFVESDSCFYAQ